MRSINLYFIQLMVQAELTLSLENRVYFDSAPHALENLTDDVAKKIAEWFSKLFPQGLLKLGISEFIDLPPSFNFWQSYSRLFMTEVCKSSKISDLKILNSERLHL